MDSTLLMKRREAIILATIDAIDECGVQAISTKEVAKKQGASERIIFKHFPTKNGLLLGVLDYFAKYDNAITQTTLSKNMKPLEAITYFLDSYSVYYENYPTITDITKSYDALLANPDKYIKGIGKVGNEVKLILDCDKLLNEDEVENLTNIQ